MALIFIAIDPETDRRELPGGIRRRGDRGPAVPGRAVTDPRTWRMSGQHSPLADNERW